MANIHPLATVHPGAKLADSVEVGPYAFIDDKVEIGGGTRILPHATVFSYVRIGKDCTIRIPANSNHVIHLEAKLTAGTNLERSPNGAYSVACCTACPHSWAAIPIAAIEGLL